MKISCAFLSGWRLLAFSFGSSLAWAESPDDFRYVIPLRTHNAEGLHRVEVPLAVYQGAARADLGDVRVFNARGEKVPFAFAGDARREVQQPAPITLPFFPLYQQSVVQGASSLSTSVPNIDLQIKQQADGTLISLRSTGGKVTPDAPQQKIQAYLVDASRNKEPLRALQLDWEARAGQIAKLHVEASDDLKSWQTLAAGAPLMNLEFGGERLVQKRVEFAPTNKKYLRLTWDRDAFQLKSLLAEIPEAQVQPGYGVLKIDALAGERSGEYVFDLGARPPVERLQLTLPQQNTVAPVRIVSRDAPKSEWRMVTSATVYRLTREGVEVVSPALFIAPHTDRYWMMRVDQKGGGLGSGMPQLEAGWMPRQIIFVARGEGPYSLAYGKAGAEPADFAVSNLLPGYKPYTEYALPLAQIEMQSATTKAAGERGAMSFDWVRDADGKRVTLWAVLLFGVALLAWMAWRLTRQMNAPPDGSEKARNAHD